MRAASYTRHTPRISRRECFPSPEFSSGVWAFGWMVMGKYARHLAEMSQPLPCPPATAVIQLVSSSVPRRVSHEARWGPCVHGAKRGAVRVNHPSYPTTLVFLSWRFLSWREIPPALVLNHLHPSCDRLAASTGIPDLPHLRLNSILLTILHFIYHSSETLHTTAREIEIEIFGGVEKVR